MPDKEVVKFGATGFEPFFYNRDNALTYVSALRSGRYRQIGHQLWDSSDGFCALGVAWDLAGRPIGATGLPSRKATSNWLGCNYITPYFPSDDLSLVTANDYHKLTFEQLADRIEQELIR